MAPEHVERWMEHNLSWLGEYKLNDVLFFPGSHDAGMSELYHGTVWGSHGNTVTQSLNILDQLRCGTRWFDIRPHWGDINIPGTDVPAPGTMEWRCGHFNGCGGMIGWQGATGQSIESVCDQVNEFLKDHNELVILRITHVQATHDGSDLSQDKHKELLQLLFGKLKKARNVPRTGPKDKENEYVKIHEMKLNDLISGTGCVIVTSREFDGPDIKDYAWRDAGIERTDYDCKVIGLALPPTKLEAFTEAFRFDTTDEIPGTLKYTTTRYQEAELPFMPQDLFSQGPGPVSMDNIKDDRLLTLCLAASQAKYWALCPTRGPPPPVICVYGGQLIYDSEVLRKLKVAIEGHGTFYVSDESMGCDPWTNIKKSCCVFYLEQKNEGDWLFYKGRFAFEFSDLDFRVDIGWIMWGGKSVKEWAYRVAYAKLLRAITKREEYQAGLDKVDNYDPDPGHKKDFIFQYRSISGQRLKQRNITESYTEHFSYDIDCITYHDTPVPHPETYEHFLWALERGEDIKITDELMSNNTNWDPDPGNSKRAKVTYMVDGHNKETSPWQGHDAQFGRTAYDEGGGIPPGTE